MWKSAEIWEEWGDGRRIWRMGIGEGEVSKKYQMKYENVLSFMPLTTNKIWIRTALWMHLYKVHDRHEDIAWDAHWKSNDGWSPGTGHMEPVATQRRYMEVRNTSPCGPCPQGVHSLGWGRGSTHTEKASPQRFPSKCNGTQVVWFVSRRMSKN